MEITGTICSISPVKQVSEKFRTREFVLDISEEYNGLWFTGYAVMQAKNALCDYLADVHNGDTVRFIVGDRVTVSFGLKGYKAKTGDNYYNQLSAHKIIAAEQTYTPVPQPKAAPAAPQTFQGTTGYAGYQPPKKEPENAPMPPPPVTIDDLPF